MVMSMYTLLRNNAQPTEQEMEASLKGGDITAYAQLEYRMQFVCQVTCVVAMVTDPYWTASEACVLTVTVSPYHWMRCVCV